MKIECGSQNHISIYRERRATKAERKRDPEAKIMAEWVHIDFSDDAPAIVVNRDLCS